MGAKLKTLGAVTVTTGGSPVPISATAIVCHGICIQAPTSNTGKIYFGDSSVTPANGHEIPPGGYFILNAIDSKGLDNFMLNDYYLDAEVSGEEARVSYIIQRAT